MFDKLIYTTLFVRDQDKALDFYTKVLGFEKRADNASPFGRFLGVALPGQDFMLVLWPGTAGAPKAGGHAPGTFVVESRDCRKAFETLKARGVEFDTAEPIEQPWGRVVIGRDPDGNRLQIVERTKR